MTLEECLNSKEIVGEYSSLNMKINGENHTVNIGDKIR